MVIWIATYWDAPATNKDRIAVFSTAHSSEAKARRDVGDWKAESDENWTIVPLELR